MMGWICGIFFVFWKKLLGLFVWLVFKWGFVLLMDIEWQLEFSCQVIHFFQNGQRGEVRIPKHGQFGEKNIPVSFWDGISIRTVFFCNQNVEAFERRVNTWEHNFWCLRNPRIRTNSTKIIEFARVSPMKVRVCLTGLCWSWWPNEQWNGWSFSLLNDQKRVAIRWRWFAPTS